MLGVFLLVVLLGGFCLFVFLITQKGLPVSCQILLLRTNKALPSLPKNKQQQKEKKKKKIVFPSELHYVVLVLEAFDGPWSDRPLVPDRSDVVPTPPKKEKPSFRWK